MKKYFSFLLIFIGTFTTRAQQYRPLPAGDIYQRLQQLQVMGTVMYVAAHPDDENTRLLSYLVHHDHMRTIYLSLTRGDGGQNILGDEQGSALGLIRTHELMAARKIDGAEQLFTSVIDFGFTKSPEETFNFWNKDDLVKEVIRAYQTYKPDVVICRFPTTGEGGHGQHTASAIVAEEAFRQIGLQQQTVDGVALWLPRRLLFNAFRFGDRNTTSSDQFKIKINQFDPLLGEGYGEMAGRSRSIHRSQGAGTPNSVGVADEYFKLIAGDSMQQSLYDGVDLSWGRVGHAAIGTAIQQVLQAFDFSNPSLSLPALIRIKQAIEKVEDEFWKRRKLEEINTIIASCAGIMVETLATVPEATPGSVLPVTVQLISRSTVPVTLQSVSFPAVIEEGGQKPILLTADSLYKINYTLKINGEEAVTEPYWLRYAGSTGAYYVDSQYTNLPLTPNYFVARIHVTILGEDVELAAPISNKQLDPVRGDVVTPLRIVPPVSVAPFHQLLIYEAGKEARAWVRLHTFKAMKGMELRVKENNKLLTSLQIGDMVAGKDTLLSIPVPVAAFKGEEILLFSIRSEGKEYNKEQHLIRYEHLPELQYFSHAWMKALPKVWESAVQKIGYIQGAGDYVDGILSLAGLQVEQLHEQAMSSAAYLNNFEAIVVGIRAFNRKEQMKTWMPALLRYVQQGGNVLVQYNTSSNLVTDQLGPYPIELSRQRVTEEDAQVTVLQPESPLLHFPNKITAADFDGWIQERGVYYPGSWDEHYQTLLSMHDVDEQPLTSAVLYTPYGKGHFVYTSLAFFRQLPAGNVGALKLMMNLISAGKTMPEKTGH